MEALNDFINSLHFDSIKDVVRIFGIIFVVVLIYIGIWSAYKRPK